MKIILFGGAFNPVHTEHLHMAEAAVSALGADKLVVLPTAVSPHKRDKLMPRDADRIEMCRLAFASLPKAEVSAYEIEKGGVSYTYLTCRHFREIYPRDELYFLMGEDMLKSFPDWKNPAEIVSLVTLAACARKEEQGGEKREKFLAFKRRTEEKFNTEVVSVGYVGEKVSSTRIRTYAALGEDISAFTLPSVCQYIKDNALYYLPDVAAAKKFLTPQRWRHSVRVAAMCAKNADRVGVTEIQAIVMGALHDAAKYLTSDSPYLDGFQPPYGVPDTVLHQFSGAYVAVNTFKVTDPDVINAIRYHTSGRENMSGAEKLLYLCDLLEEERNFDGVDRLRALFADDIDACLAAALEQQVGYLRTTGKPVYDLTEKAYEYLKKTSK